MKTFLKRSLALLMSISLFGALQTGMFSAGAATTTPDDFVVVPYPFGQPTTTAPNDIAAHPYPYLFVDNQSGHTNIGRAEARYVDNDHYIIYRLPLASKSDYSISQAHLLLLLSQDYNVWVAGGNDLTTDQAKAMFTGAGTSDATYDHTAHLNTNKKDVVFNVMDYVNAGDKYVYFKIGDNTPSNGWGGIFYRARLTYTDPAPEDDSLATTDNPGPLSFYAGQDSESRYAYQIQGTQLKDGENFRFCDGGDYALYRMPYDNSKDTYLKLVVAANYYVQVSVSGDHWYTLAANASNYDTMASTDPNYGSVHSQQTLCLPLSRYKSRTGAQTYQYIYFKIGDQTTSGGNGGQIFKAQLCYTSDPVNVLYNPFSSTDITVPQLAPSGDFTSFTKTGMSAPSLAPVNSQKTTTVKTNSTVTYNVANGMTTSTVESTVSVEGTSAAASANNSSVTTSGSNGVIKVIKGTPAVTEESIDPVSTSIIIGGIALVLIGLAVAQFILFERKRRLTKNI